MADVDRDKRPLSPHLTIYRPYMSMMMSIFHRVTGVALTLAAVLVVWWFLAAATGPEYFGVVDGLLTSWFGGLILVLSLLAFWYHFWNGVRHLWWDAGRGFALDQVSKTGFLALGGTLLFFLITLFFAFS